MTAATFLDTGPRFRTLQPVWLRTPAGIAAAIVCNDAGKLVRVQPYLDVATRKMGDSMEVERRQLQPMKL